MLLTTDFGGKEAWPPTPKWNTRFSLHFPKELSYGYLGFEGNGKIPLGRQGKRREKERAMIKKLQNILLLAVGFELMTSWLPDGRLNRFGHPDT